MTSIAHESEQVVTADIGFSRRVDKWLERAAERLNPILVKESRQALKSKQFVITFSLLLLCGWGWSLLGVVLQMPAIYYAPAGPYMLIGYYFVLTVPMLLIVPFAAYRSLATEREDGTYELLSITTLSARQIVTGKLGSAVLQMLVYYSALSPCIAFTYLLRGVDVVTMLIPLFYTLVASILLSTVALMVATVSRARHVQVLLSVALLLGLALATFLGCMFVVWLFETEWQLAYDDADFWIAQGGLLTGCVSYMILFTLAGAAQLTFASDNRSTRLRIVMLVQQVLFTGWMAYYWFRERDDDVLYVLLSISGIHWMVMGALMTGEWAQLSPRVKRRLPQSFLGRAFLTWFNPGSGTGYVFAVASLFSVTFLALQLALVGQFVGFLGSQFDGKLLMFGTLLCAYVAAYLGVGRLFVLLLRRFLYFGLLLPFVIHALLLLFGAALPWFLQAWAFGFDDFDHYTVLQVTNWLWTLIEAGDSDILTTPSAPALVFLGAAVVLAVNLAVAAREVEQVRQATPQRVVQDELDLHPERAAQPKKPASPFDD